MDIGAFHPFKFNNTYLFYKFGSVGINIEPNPGAIQAFKKYRPKDLNLNVGVGPQSGVMEYFQMAHKTLNTFSKQEAERMQSEEGIAIEKTFQVEIKTIVDVIRESSFKTFPDFLSIDIEGYELEILGSIDYSNDSPKVICVETVLYSNSGKSMKNEELIAFLQSKNYYHYSDTMINSIFVRKDLIQDKFKKSL